MDHGWQIQFVKESEFLFMESIIYLATDTYRFFYCCKDVSVEQYCQSGSWWKNFFTFTLGFIYVEKNKFPSMITEFILWQWMNV